jgi:hypothetical protein
MSIAMHLSNAIGSLELFTFLKYRTTILFTNVIIKMFTFVNQIIRYEFRRII